MSRELNENEIDKIFRKAIEPVDTEPSDEFWRKAAENVITRGSQLKEGNASQWRAIAFILGAGLLILGYFTYKLATGLKSEEKEVAMLKKTQNANTGKSNAGTSTGNTINDVADIPAVVPVNSNISSNANNTPSPKKEITKYTTHMAKTQMSNEVINASHSKLAKSQNSTLAYNKQSDISKHTKKHAAPQVENNANDGIVSTNRNYQVSNATVQGNSTENLNSTQSMPGIQKPVQIKPDSLIRKQSVNMLNTNKQSSIVASDTAKIPSYSIDSARSRYTVSAFFSPDIMMGYKFTSNTSWGSQIESAIKSGEKQTFSYTTGVKAAYSLSSHFSISAGIAYQSFSFNANPGYIYAQKQSNGEVGYNVATSSGLVNCPYYGPTKAGDSLKMSLASSRTYLEIPISFKYFIGDNPKFKFYLIGGMEANISLGEETYMNWQSIPWNETGTATANTTDGAESMYLSYYLGIGADYRIGKYISLYVEPGLHNAITPIDNNVDVISYPRLFSIAAGLTYHF
ncbi:MAG TPA: outer membrane beta-barrel protein [Bacteroidia bacterium]|nr:outer membrane beta-barrel protein [Bacteroidia bacterium]